MEQKSVVYHLKRSPKRKSVLLRISSDGDIEVLAPKRMPRAAIDHFVLQKNEWIETHRAQALEQKAKREAYRMNEIYFLGRLYPTALHDSGIIDLKQNILYLPNAPLDAQREQMVRWYKAQAKDILTKRTALWADKMGTTYEAVKITGAKTRWGSCTAKGNLNFSWRLILLSGNAIDYVVIHELAHRTHMDHGPQFWTLVGEYCPNYGAMQKVLKEMQQKLGEQGW